MCSHMTEQERDNLIAERNQIRLDLDNSRFVDPKKVRRIDAINSLLMTDGEVDNLQIKVVKGRRTTLGLNAKSLIIGKVK